MDEIKLKFETLHFDTLPQPTRVTEMRYATNGMEENMFTLVMSALKEHMTGEKISYNDLWGEPIFQIKLSEISPNIPPRTTFARLRNMQKREFGYAYTSPKNGKNIDVYGIIFPTIERQGDFIQIHINKHAIPWLTYIDKGITYFSKKTALALNGGITKRIYKFLCTWKTKGGKRIKVEELKEILDLKDSYSELRDFKRFVLEPAKEEMLNNQICDIWFEYTTETSKELKEKLQQEGRKGRKPHNQIVFKIHTRYKSKDELIEKSRKNGSPEHWIEIYKFAQSCLGKVNPKAQEIADSCAEEGPQFMNQRYKDIKKLREKCSSVQEAFNFFMSGAQKKSNLEIFKFRYKKPKK